MPGTIEGGKAAAATNKARYGSDFYARIGSRGGKKGTTGGFWYKKYVSGDVDAIRRAGEKGGRVSKRPKKGM